MKKSIVAASAFLVLAFAQAANAGPYPGPSAESRTRMVWDEADRADSIALAQCAIDAVFPRGAARDGHLARTYNRLDTMLEQLAGANETQRDRIAKEAYNIRLQLEAGNYRYYYVQAAQAVAMAANVGTTVSEHGHEWSPIYTGDADDVSYVLTKDAVNSVDIWLEGRGLAPTNCLR